MKAYHSLYIGDSGTGKTTGLREAHDRYNGVSIWINHNETSGIPKGGDDPVSSRRGLDSRVRALSNWNDARDLRIEYRTNNLLAGAKTVRQFCHDIWEEARVPTQVILDEAQDALPRGSVENDNPVKKMLHQDRDKGIKVVLATQNPKDLEIGPISNCRYFVWFGSPAIQHKSWLEKYHFPMDELANLGDFDFIVFSNKIGENGEAEILHHGKTNERYG